MTNYIDSTGESERLGKGESRTSGEIQKKQEIISRNFAVKMFLLFNLYEKVELNRLLVSFRTCIPATRTLFSLSLFISEKNVYASVYILILLMILWWLVLQKKEGVSKNKAGERTTLVSLPSSSTLKTTNLFYFTNKMYKYFLLFSLFNHSQSSRL